MICLLFFLAGFLVGGPVGLLVAAMMIAAKKGDHE